MNHFGKKCAFMLIPTFDLSSIQNNFPWYVFHSSYRPVRLRVGVWLSFIMFVVVGLAEEMIN